MNILITGGASGLGEAITRKLAKDSENVVYFTFNSSVSNAENLKKEFQNLIPIKCDFKDRDSVSALTDQISNLDLDILINNAYTGEPVKTHFNKIRVEEFSAEFNHNILPTVLLTQSAINGFRKKKSGKIITILTSFLLNTPPSGAAVYVANKAYLGSLVKSWATENAKFNITSNSVSPSFMISNFTKDVDERVLEQMVENHPLKRILTLDEVADTVHFLANASSHINGADIVINAGMNVK
jgi:3-oxoacyl-[acyl-carrier protein] reductase